MAHSATFWLSVAHGIACTYLAFGKVAQLVADQLLADSGDVIGIDLPLEMVTFVLDYSCQKA